MFPARSGTDRVDQHSIEEVAGDWTSYSVDKLTGTLQGVTDYRWDADFGHVRMIICPAEKLGDLVSDQTQDLPDITPGDVQYLNNLHQQKSPSMKTETRSKLKAIVQEVLSEMTDKEAKKSLPVEKTENMKKAALPQTTKDEGTMTSPPPQREPKGKAEMKLLHQEAGDQPFPRVPQGSIVRMIREYWKRWRFRMTSTTVSSRSYMSVAKDLASSTGAR